MSSIHDPMETSSTHASPPATDHDIEKLNSDNDEPSEVSNGGNLRGDLESAFNGAFDFKGKFALSETFTSTPLSGLYIEGIGVIRFPLNEHDAKLIEAAATQAPFGNGAATVADTTVRGTFEITPDKFSFKNPAWTEFLQTVTKKVADGLGLPPNQPPPQPELYKLLLYKTGSHFLPHKDTEKSQGIFASLTIILPSRFEGGEVHVSHGNHKDAFDISPSSGFATSALAWYTDVTHEIKPVTSGYRLAISYNLVNASPDLPSPHLPDMHSAVSAVEGIFCKWKKGRYEKPEHEEPESSGAIAYLLDHKYSGDSLVFAALKGKDAIIISNIRGVAEKHGVCLHLGLLECQVSGDADVSDMDPYDNDGPPSKMESVYDTEYRIDGLYDFEGDLAEGADSVTLNAEFDMIPKDPGFIEEEPDTTHFECYVTNELKYFYRRPVLIMFLARELSIRPLDMGGANYALTKLKRWQAEGPTKRNIEMAQFLANRVYLSSSWETRLPEQVSLLIDLALEWDDFTMWEEVLKKSGGGKYKVEFNLDTLIRAWGVFTFDRTKKIIEEAIRRKYSTRAALELIRALQTRAPAQDQQGLKGWWKKQTIAVLSSVKPPLSVSDVEMFVGIAESEGLLFFSKTIVKQLVKFRSMFDFWIGLAEGLWKNRDKLVSLGGTPDGAYTVALNHILDTLIAAAIPEYSGDIHHRRPLPNTAHTEPKDHTRILTLLDLMFLTDRTRNSDQLIALVSQPQGTLLVTYQKFIVPLIPKLKARYQECGTPGVPVLDAFLRAFVGRWLQDLLGSPSKQPEALVKRLVCECGDCARVNKFLQSTGETETFRAAQKRRSHMEAILKSTLPRDVTFTTIRGGSPLGLQVTKTKETLTMDTWSGRVGRANAFLALVGTPDELARIMGERYQDVQATLAGTKPYTISNSTPVVAPVEDALVVSTSGVQATASGTQAGPVVVGVKRKAEDDGDMIDLT